MPELTQHLTADRRTHRHGRALVELLVAALLLSVGTFACLALIQTTLRGADLAVQLTAARDAARDRTQTVHANPCLATAGSSQRERTTATWAPVTSGALRQHAVTLTLAPTPLQLGSTHGAPPAPPRSLSATLSGWCP